MKARLRRLEVECYRGLRDHRVFEFPDGLTVIIGPVGSGKSSILSAIQFALYGLDFNVSMKFYPRENLINVGCDKATVILTFEVPEEGVYSIERSLEKREGRIRESVALRTPHGDVFNDPLKVEGMIEELLGLDFQEFIRSVSLSYILLYMLAYGSRVARSKAMDILLGINSIRAFHDALAIKRVEGRLAELNGQLERLKGEYNAAVESLKQLEEKRRSLESEIARIRGRLEELSSRMKDLEEARENYENISSKIENEKNYLARIKEKIKHPASELDIYALNEEMVELKQELRSVLERLVVPQDLVARLEAINISPENLEESLSKLEKILNDVWSRYDREWENVQESITELEQKKADLRALEKILVELEPSVTEYEEAEEKILEIQSKYGTQEQLEKEVKTLEQEIHEITRRLQQYRCIQQLRQSLLEQAARVEKVECPVCGSQLEASAALDMRGELSQITKNIIEHERKLQELDKKLRGLRDVIEDLRNLKVILVNHELNYEKYKEYLERKESLNEEIREDDLLVQEKQREYKEIESRLIRLDDKLGELKRKLGEYTLSLETIAIQAKIKELEEARKKVAPLYAEYQRLKEEETKLKLQLSQLETELKAHEQTYLKNYIESIQREIEELESRVSKLEKLSEQLRKIKYATRTILTRQRREKIQALNKQANEILRSIYQSEAVEAVELVITEKPKSGGIPPVSYYDIYVATKAGKYRFNELLSDGQKTIVLLALLLAMYSQLRHKADFIILDEPLPNVDNRIKLAFLETLAKNRDIAQVVLTTQAEDLPGKIGQINIIKLD
ncbi:MAG: SMC family ATPase [Infirmifilum sp.]